MSVVIRALALPLLALIWLYRMLISPLLGANCRHLPTCSEYANEAVLRHGPLRGGWFALKRISRCHPWAAPMVDPVPDAKDGGAACCGKRP
ncbi:MAG: membrane protein insertion efficiency factor YidD [Candidatus Puniceispirillaceae bacterium]